MSVKQYKIVEGMLYNYKNTQGEIRNIALEIKEISKDFNGIRAISYEEKTGSTNAFNSSVENEIISREKRLEYLNNLKESKEIQLEKIDNAIEAALSEKEKLIVKLRYFERLSNKDVARKLDLTEQRVSEIKSKIPNKLINLIFFKEILKEY